MAPPAQVCDPGAAGPTALFVGSLGFPPKIEAVDIPLDELIPRVRQLSPEARLLVVGRRPSVRMRRLLVAQPWIEFREDVPTMAEAYADARCVLMPFRSGSGTKLKLYEAMSFGLPVVSTPKGAAGVDLVPGEGVIVSKDIESMATAT